MVSFVVLLVGAWQAAAAEACVPTTSAPTRRWCTVETIPIPAVLPQSPAGSNEQRQIQWSFSGGTMSATDSTGMGLFNSGLKSGSSAS